MDDANYANDVMNSVYDDGIYDVPDGDHNWYDDAW